MFFKLLKYDFKIGIIYQFKKLIISACVFSGVFVDCCVRLRSYMTGHSPFQIEKTLGNVFLYVFGGAQAYDKNVDTQFIFPAIWILIYLLLLYFTLYYPYNNLEENGQNILVRSGGRTLWWISKCCWAVLTVAIYFAVSWIVLTVACKLSGIPLSTRLSPNIWKFLEMRDTAPYLYPENLNLEIFVLPFLVMTSLSLLQMTVSLFIRPIYSYIITAIIVLSSSYYQSPWLLGNYAMPVRSSRMIENGVNPYIGIAFSLALTICSFAVGIVKFKKYDILKKE